MRHGLLETLPAFVILAGALALYYIYFSQIASRLHITFKSRWGRPLLAFICLAVVFAAKLFIDRITR